MSLITIRSSAKDGIGGNPSIVELILSFIAPPASDSSSQCSIIGRSYMPAYSMARFRIEAVLIAIPSSEKPTAPASNNSAIGESTSPFLPMVAAATGYTSTKWFDACFLIKETTSAESIAGSVFGIQATPVNPPFAALSHPDFTVSLSSLPGSLR